MSYNSNAIHILEKNLDKVEWYYMCSNQNPLIIQLLEQNQDKIDWKSMFINLNIFCCDYDYYKKRMDIYREELMKKVFHPQRLSRYLELGYDLFDMID